MLVSERRNFCTDVVPYDCRMLLFFIEDGEKAGWLGFEDRDAYLRDGLKLDPRMVDLAIKGIKLQRPDEPIAFNEAVVRGLGDHGGDRRSEEAVETRVLGRRGRENQPSPRRLKYGETRSYIIARLERDAKAGDTKAAALLQHVQNGDLSSKAAGREAGFIRKTWTAPADVNLLATAIAKRYPGWKLVRE